MTGTDPAPEPADLPDLPETADLPEGVRARVVTLTAAVLPDVVRLPPALRKVASFAPNRRARLGATAILAALDDEEVRGRLAVHVAARTTYDLGSLDPRDLPEGLDPAEVAALAWLLRLEGWQALYAATAGLAAERGAQPVDAEEVVRLRQRVQELEQQVRDQRAAQRSAERARGEELRQENATLRRRLGETRGQLTEAREEAQRVAGEAEELRGRLDALTASSEKELRQLRAEVARHQAAAGADRRAAREEKEEATVRARVLLDTLMDAAAGLRRELALPAVSRTPGERAEEGLGGEPGEAAGTALRVSAGPLLEQYLAMPRARLVVDGYNVSKSVWPSSPLEAQRIRLLRSLAPLAARTGAETTVVFDAAQVTTRPVVAAPRGVRVVFSPPGVIADDVIRGLVAAEPAGRVVLVVSDDQEVAGDVTRAGARSVSTAALLQLLDAR